MPEHDTRQFMRVYNDIAPLIIKFFDDRKPGDEFTSNQLWEFIKKTFPTVAPESPTRIMRALREEEKINYEPIKRNKSNYRVLALGAPRNAPQQFELL